MTGEGARWPGVWSGAQVAHRLAQNGTGPLTCITILTYTTLEFRRWDLGGDSPGTHAVDRARGLSCTTGLRLRSDVEALGETPILPGWI